MMTGVPALMWFRRDLRLADNPALLAAAEQGPVLGVYVIDPDAMHQYGTAQRAYLSASLSALNSDMSGALVVVSGNPAEVLPNLASQVGASQVHTAGDYTPYGINALRNLRVACEQEGLEFQATGSPYAVKPGLVRNQTGRPYRVFTPFAKAWRQHGWEPALPTPSVEWIAAESDPIPQFPTPHGLQLPPAGDAAALARWAAWQPNLDEYHNTRDLPGLATTSGLSVALRFGEIHPRTMLATLASSSAPGAPSLINELAWREFFADQLLHFPTAEQVPLRAEFNALETDTDPAALAAWQRGETGFGIVDAGLRELRATGLMHNRVRMVVASFLIKDLHLDWRVGAEHFKQWLLDYDPASNALNWQWVAGCGSDAAPYYRVFNPDTQAAKFDPDRSYQRRWVPELDTPAYPEPIVDHRAERLEALRRFQLLHSSR